jgi:hypothetical protein
MQHEPQLGDYRAVEFSTGFFVQCYSERIGRKAVRRWWGWSTEVERTGYWRTVRDQSVPALKDTVPAYPALTFPTLADAQAFVDKLRYDEANYPKYHDLK